MDEFISDALLWTPAYGRAKAARPARTYIQQLCEDTGCSSEDLPEAMNDRKKREREGQGYPCWRRDMMMMMMMIYTLCRERQLNDKTVLYQFSLSQRNLKFLNICSESIKNQLNTSHFF